MVEPGKPSDPECLRAIRAHVDQSMRYHATAFLRGGQENAELLRVNLAITANILAFLEGDSLDERSALEARDTIIRRYLEQAESDPYEPGNCSFCGERPVAAWFEGPSYKTHVRRSTDVRAEEAWLACGTCLALVEANDRDELARRGANRLRRRSSGRGIPDDSLQAHARRSQDEHFWQSRDRP